MYENTDYKNAVVTGAARGIGKAVARALAAEGLNVVVSDVMMEEAEATAAELAREFNVQTLAVKADVSNAVDAENLIRTTVKQFGSIDFLINNAGVTRDNLAVRMSEKEWDIVLDVNLKGTFLCSQFAAKEMMKRRFGRIVNMASVVGVIGTAGQANYAASKAGVIALTKSFARELAKRNICINAIAPGFILTEMTEKLSDKAKEEYYSGIPLNRAGTTEDIAGAVKFLISPAASYITGTVLNVSGGLLM